jgi:hypothetical protein
MSHCNPAERCAHCGLVNVCGASQKQQPLRLPLKGIPYASCNGCCNVQAGAICGVIAPNCHLTIWMVPGGIYAQ